MMIFDNTKIKALIKEYNLTKNQTTLAEIMGGSRSLVEAIISGYDSFYRDDLIQEAYVRLQYALPYYNTNMSAHTYFTTVIRNACATYLTKQSRHANCLDIEDETLFDKGYLLHTDISNIDLKIIIEYNRKRFQSIDVNVLDQITAAMFNHITSCKYVGIKKLLCELEIISDLSKDKLLIIYNSTLICMRLSLLDYYKRDYTDDNEFNNLEDLRQIIGNDEIYNKLRVLFSGITLKL